MSVQLDLNDPELYATLECMEINGGNFAAQLVRAFKAADPANRKKILDTWPELFEKYGPNGIFAPQQRYPVKSLGYAMVQHLQVRKS